MNKDIIIVGAGGLGREVLWLLEELNFYNAGWDIKGFVDDDKEKHHTLVNGYPVIGDSDWLSIYNDKINVVCCIANPNIRENVIKKISKNSNINFPNIIAYGVRYSNRVRLGMGNIICLGTTLTVDIEIGNFNIINPSCTIGHDVVIKDFVTVYPGANISGNVTIQNLVEIGTGSQIIQGLSICDDVILGAGSVVIKDISEKGTYVGVPVRRVK